MKSKYFFVDCDECILDTKLPILSYINERYGIGLDPEEFYCGNSYHDLVNQHLPPEEQVTAELFYKRFGEEFLLSHEYHRQMKPMSGSVEAIQKLSNHYTIWVVTARQRRNALILEPLLQELVGDAIAGVHYVWHHDENNELYAHHKKDFIDQHDADRRVAYLDDNPNEVRHTQNVVPSYLFDVNDHHPELAKELTRFTEWEQVTDTFLR